MSALKSFKAALVPGARFVVTFEETRIVGNLGVTVLPGNTQTREVVRTTSSRVYFKKQDGSESVFDFPPASQMSAEGNGFVWSHDGRKVLTYQLEATR